MATRQINRVVEQIRKVVRACDAAEVGDGQLLECFIARREEAAFESLLHRHGPMVLSVCQRVLGNHHDAEDAFQATFLVLARKASSIVPRQMVGNWLYGVAYHTALKARSVSAKRQVREKQMNPMPEREAPAQDSWTDLQRVLDQELSQLSDTYRVPIILCDLEGKSQKEAAQHLGVAEGTIASRLSRGRALLAKRLAHHGLAYSAGALAVALSQNGASACVSSVLASSTLQAAGAFATGQPAAGLVSGSVASLTDGMLKAMLLNKLKMMAAVLVLLGIFPFGGGLLTQYILAGQKAESQQNGPDKRQKDPTNTVEKQPEKGGQKNKTDLDRIQGTWQMTKFEVEGGNPPPPEFVEKRKLVFKDNKVSFLEDDKTVQVQTFVLDSAKKPPTIDFTATAGPDKGKIASGIYRIKGDSLTICIGSAGEKRPSEFKGNGKLDLVQFERVKAKDKGSEPAKPEPAPAKKPVKDKDFDALPDLPPAEQVKALMKEYQDLVDAHERAFRGVKGEAQRIDYWKNYPSPERLFPRFMALAEKHPKDAAAVDALIWVATHHSPYTGSDPKDQENRRKTLETQRRARAWLLRDHLASDKLPLAFGGDEKFLYAVLEKSPHRHIRGLACYTLAEQRIWLSRRVTRYRNEIPDWQQNKIVPRQSPEFTTDIGKLTKETETLLEQVLRDFADVGIEDRRNGKTLGVLAKGHLHEIRHLAIGMPAPQLKSVDLDGKPVQLADLKGKVVVLDVWAIWCGPCQAMIPHQRELVKRLDTRPFTLVSISVDEKRETLAKFLKKEPMPWTHWYNGPDGNIITDLNVCYYPTIYVLDAKGVIRYKDVRGKFLDQAVDALLLEIEEKSPRK